MARPAARAVLLVLALGGCYSPTFGECRVACGSGGDCPPGMHCLADQFCHASTAEPACSADLAAADLAGGPDGGGAVRWQIAGPAIDDAPAIAVDATGATVVVGGFHGGFAFGQGAPLPSAGGQDAFVAKYDVSGAPMWARTLGGPLDDRANAVAIDPASGAIFITGSFSDRLFLDGKTGAAPALTANAGGGQQIFLMQLASADGAPVGWQKALGATGASAGRALARTITSSSHALLLAGSFQNDVDFGGGSTASSGGSVDGFFALYDYTTGEWLTGNRFGGALADTAYAATADAAGNFGVAGSTQDGRALFVAHYTFGHSGVFDWTFESPLATAAAATGIALDNDNQLLVAGSFSVGVDVGGKALSSSGGAEGFVAQFATTPAGDAFDVKWAKSVGGAGMDHARAIAVAPGGDVVVTGQFADGARFDPAAAPVAATGLDAFVARYSTAGANLSVRSALGTMADDGTSLAFDGPELVAAGTFDRALAFTSPLLTATTQTLYLVRLP